MKRGIHILLSGLIIGGILFASSCKPKKSVANAVVAQRTELAYGDYFIDACTHYNNSNYDMALKLFNKCIDLKPEEASAYYQISRIYNAESATEKSLQFALKAYQFNSVNPYYAIWYARLLRNVNNLESAVEVLESCRKSNPLDEYIVKELDGVYALQSATDKRLTIWNDLIAKKGFKLNYTLKLIELYKQKKDYTAAHQQYDNIKKAAPGKVQYFIDDGNLYLETGDKTNAFANFEKALSINPNNWQLNSTLFKHYRSEKNYTQAAKYLQLGLNDPYTKFDSKAMLAAELNKDLASDSSNRQYTLIFAKALSEQYSNNAQALNTAGIFFEEQYLYSKADWCYSKSIELLPNTYDAWLGAIRCHQRLYGPAKTLLLIDSALEYFPNTASLYTMAAQNADQLKKYTSVIEYCNAGTSFAIINADIQNLSYYKAKAEFYKNDYKSALQSLSFAANDDKSEGRFLDLLGDIYYHLNQKDLALLKWKKALENGATNSKLSKKISDGKYYE